MFRINYITIIQSKAVYTIPRDVRRKSRKDIGTKVCFCFFPSFFLIIIKHVHTYVLYYSAASTGFFLNIAIGAQLFLSAIVTGLSASNTSRHTVSVLGISHTSYYSCDIQSL